MTRFESAREAKEFLVARIIEQAKRENLTLSEVERKMLYFSETHWTVPDMLEVNQRFDHEYNQDEYNLRKAITERQPISNDETFEVRHSVRFAPADLFGGTPRRAQRRGWLVY